MSLNLSERVRRAKPSPTLAVTARAAEMRAAGHDVIGLGAGEPDFDTPEHVKEAAVQALRDGFTKYTAVDGLPELKDAVIAKFKRDNGLRYERNQILVSCGAKHSIYNLCQAMLDLGDEAIIPAPYWVSYPDMVKLAEATPVIIDSGQARGFKIAPDQLAAAINEHTRLLVLNSPCNPTGAAYTKAELVALGKVLLRHPNVAVVTDDIYEHIYWGEEPFANIVNAIPELYERTVVVNGVSKVYAMTGWRIGYAAGPAPLIGAMKKIQSQSTSNPAAVSQKAAVAALNGDQRFVADMNAEFKSRHDYVVEALNALPGVSCLPCAGAFYAFPECSAAIKSLGLGDDTALCEHLIEHAGVALVPGAAFGAPGYVRLSYATDLDTLRSALGRLEAALSKPAG